MKILKFLLTGIRVQIISAERNVFSFAKVLNSSDMYKIHLIYLLIILFSVILNYNTGRTQIVNEQWVARYSGSENSNSQGSDVTSNVNGDVYVTGNITDSNGTGILTIKYNSSGQEIWARTYNSSVNSSDYGIVSEVDINQDLLVCGSESSNGTVALIKYDSSGDTLWTRSYPRSTSVSNSPVKMKTDVDGSIFVTLISTGNDNYGYTILKYSANGSLFWKRQYNYDQYFYDKANALVLGEDNYFYTADFRVTDSNSIGYIIKHDKISGDSIWSLNFPYYFSADLVINKEGMIFSTGNNNGQFITYKIDPSGEILWSRNYNGTGVNAVKIGVDTNYNCYVAGYRSGNPPRIAIIKYNSSGDDLWTRLYDGSAGTSCLLSDFLVEKNGDLYIGGSNTIIPPYSDYLTMKYNTNGDFIWMKRYNFYRTHSDYIYSLTKDNTGSIIVTGLSYNNLIYSCTTIKYSQTVGVNQISNQIPLSGSLDQNYPNPFNPSTKIRYRIKENVNVIIKIYDQLGKEVLTLLDHHQNSGVYEIDFHGDKLTSGLYFYTIIAGNFRDTKRMIMIK